MTILDENYWLEADQLQWILKYKSVRIVTDPDTLEDKNVTSENQWYHGRLQHALQNYLDQKLRESGEVEWSAKDIQVQILKAYEYIDKAVAQIKATTGLEPKHGTYNKEIPLPKSKSVYIHEGPEMPQMIGENWPYKVEKNPTEDIALRITSMCPDDTFTDYPSTPEESFDEEDLM